MKILNLNQFNEKMRIVPLSDEDFGKISDNPVDEGNLEQWEKVIWEINVDFNLNGDKYFKILGIPYNPNNDIGFRNYPF